MNIKGRLPQNLENKVFGKLTVKTLNKIDDRSNYIWNCVCECGNKCLASTHQLNNKRKRSCGCGRAKTIDITGNKYGELTVLGFDCFEYKGKRKDAKWKCICSCGKEVSILKSNLKEKGGSRSCGCRHIADYKFKIPGEANKRHVMKSYRKHATQNDREFHLSYDDMERLFQSNCYYCGSEPLSARKTLKSAFIYVYNGIDRVDNNKGYTLDNVVSCCKLCNFGKRNLSTDEFLTWIHKVYNYNFPEMQI
jgi:hypothetical protein